MIASKWLIHTSVVSGASSGSSSDGAVRMEHGPAVLATHPPPNGAAELLGDQLGAVADAEHRHTELVDRRIEARSTLDVDALRPTRQHDRQRRSRGDVGGDDRVGHDLGEDVQLANPPGDELGVLSAEVDDEDGLMLGGQDSDGTGEGTVGISISGVRRWGRELPVPPCGCHRGRRWRAVVRWPGDGRARPVGPRRHHTGRHCRRPANRRGQRVPARERQPQRVHQRPASTRVRKQGTRRVATDADLRHRSSSSSPSAAGGW